MSGPHVSMALLCERIAITGDHIEIDHVLQSFPRRVPGDPATLVAFDLQAIVILIPGDLRGRHSLFLRALPPSGFPGPTLRHPVELRHPGEPTMWTPRVRSTLAEVGLWWFDVLLDDEAAPPLTRIPLVVVPEGA